MYIVPFPIDSDTCMKICIFHHPITVFPNWYTIRPTVCMVRVPASSFVTAGYANLGGTRRHAGLTVIKCSMSLGRLKFF